jgi:hypothetical protein
VAVPDRSAGAQQPSLRKTGGPPTGTTPARRLVVNWRWVPVEGSVSQLRFYVRRDAPIRFRDFCPLKIQLTLKETAWPRRRIAVKMKSNPITWNPRDLDDTPEPPPEESTGYPP